METEISKFSKEERRLQIIKELEQIKIGDSAENEQRLKRVRDLENELMELDPPPSGTTGSVDSE